MDRNELLWRVYQDNRTFAQFHENQRATATALVAGGNAALIAAMIGTNGLDLSDVPLSVMTVLLSTLGFVIALKSTEKLRRHNKRAARFLECIVADDPSLDINAIKTDVDFDHDKQHWLTSRFRQSTLWVGINIAIALLSSVVFGTILWKAYCG